MLNKQLLLFNSGIKPEDTPFYVDFGTSPNGVIQISDYVIPQFYISYDGIEWSNQTYGAGDRVKVPSGRVYFKAVEPTNALYDAIRSLNRWNISGGSVNLGGNINSLLSADDPSAVELDRYAFVSMFQSTSNIVDASELILPTKILRYNEYYSMFYECTALRASPIILAETIDGAPCVSMFNSCRSLTQITCLAVQILKEYSCNQWVARVNSTGTFYKNSANSTWQRGISGIPQGWDIIDYN